MSDNGKIRLDEIEIDGAYNEKNSFILEYKNGNVKAFEDGNIIAQQGYATPTKSFTLFSEGGSIFPSFANLYYTKIYDNDTLVRDYIPVIDSTSRPCLFDKVSKECYYNQGTGEFLYG